MKPLRRRHPHPQVPLVSTADVAFLLLIFFLSTAVFGVERGLLLALPGRDAPVAAASAADLNLAIDADASLKLDGRTVTVEDLRGRLHALSGSGRDPLVRIEIDPAAPYALFVAALDEIKLAGIRRIVIASTPMGGAS